MADWSCRERNLPQPIRSTSRIVRTFYTCLHRLRFASSSFSRKLNRIVQYTSLTDNIVDSLQNNSREREKGRKKKKKPKKKTSLSCTFQWELFCLLFSLFKPAISLKFIHFLLALSLKNIVDSLQHNSREKEKNK